MKVITLQSGPKGVQIDDGDTILALKKDITKILLEHILIPENDRGVLYCHGGTKKEYVQIDYRAILNAGFSIYPVMGLQEIKALKISKPKPGKEKSKRSEDKEIYYLRDSQLLSGLTLPEFIKAFTGKTLRESILLFDSILTENFDISLHKSPTLAGLSMSAFRLHIKTKEYDLQGLSGRFRTACEDSYFGGHTYCFNVREHEREVGIDANSHYASVMLKYQLPDGDPTFRFGDDWEEDDLVCASVLIPQDSFPFLKSRLGDYSTISRRHDIKKVGTGRISGWFWGFELKFQQKHGGIVYADEYIRWPKRTNILNEHIGKCRILRNQDKKSPLGTTVKLLQNSLYGKFAQRPSETEMIISLSDPGGGAWNRKIPGQTSPVLPEWLWERPSPYMFKGSDMIHWGSYITARARFELASTIDLIGWKNVDYADTDSIFAETDFFVGEIEERIGEDYGQWKLLGFYKKWQASAPKCYKWENAEGYGQKHAGIPQKDLLIKGLKEVLVQKRPSLKTVIAQRKSSESYQRMVSVSDPKASGKFDKWGDWIPDHIDQTILDFKGRRRMSRCEKTWLTMLMSERPDLFDLVPIPDLSWRGKLGDLDADKKEKARIERITEKKIEWIDSHPLSDQKIEQFKMEKMLAMEDYESLNFGKT